MEDEEKLAAMEILVAILTSVRTSAIERFPSVINTMLNLISRYGNCSTSSTAYSHYALVLCLKQRYQEGNRFGQLAVDLLEKDPHPGRAAEIQNLQYSNVRHWMQSIRDLITPLKTYHRMAMQAGDFETSMYCLLNYTVMLWGSGKPLEHCLVEIEPIISLCQSKNQQFSLQAALMLAEFAHNLTEMSPATTRLEGKWFSEETMMSRLEGNQFLLALYGLLKMKLCYLLGDPGAAYDHLEEVLKHRSSINPHYLYTEISFYGSLSCAAGLAGDESDSDRKERLERLKLFEEELKLWAETAPMNYQHQYHLLLAEKSRVTDKHWEAVQFYEKAVKGAQENRFVHDEALANELFGQFWLEQSNDSIAEMYMRAARTLYQQWGAAAKVTHLESSYPHYFETRSVSDGQPDTSGTLHIEAADPITPVQMDMDGIISASQMLNVSQMLSSKTDLDQLLVNTLKLVMSFSGAERAALLLKQGEDWFVQALGDIRSSEHEVLLNQPFDPSYADNETGLVPAAVFYYCLRSKGVLLAEDATLDPRFAGDRTVKTHRIRSMACIPVLSHGKLNAILYLENRQIPSVFTRDRVEILTHLSSQFGISVENALLYENLNRKISELQKSEERYALAVAGSAAGLWDWDIPSNELYVSDRLLELLGFALDEISFTMDEFWSQLHPDDHPVVRRAVDAHLEKRLPFHMDYRLQTRSGEYRWFHARGQALWDETGRATRMSGSLTDIEHRKQAESALLDSRQKLIKAEQIAGMGFLDWDLKTNEIKWSREVYDLYGIDPETPATIELAIGLIHPDDHEFVKENLDLAIQGVRDYDIDHRMVRPDGKIIWVHARGDLEWDKGGRPTTLLGTVLDITERKMAEEEMRIQQDALARVDRTSRMGQLAGSIAHELNQPLTGILSTAQAGEIITRRGQYEPDEMAEILAAIAADAKRAGRVIHSLRELYRDQKRDLEPVKVNDVIDETVQLLQSEFIKQHAQVTTQCTSSAPMVKGNRVQIQQVLLNLIMNGNQAMSGMAQEDRHLHLETACDEKEVMVWVEDSGPGIDADKIDRIFEPLTTWKSGGTGMGLAMSQSIVRTHQGRIWAQNRPEGGARVGFTLPLLKEEPQT
jgi:PAS domain S-box-containing protein